MRRIGPRVLRLSLLVVLFPVCGSVCRTIPLSVQVTAIVGLGLHAAMLLWRHRERLHDHLNG